MIPTLICATTSLVAPVSSEAPCAVIEDCCNLPLLNPDLADRKTLKLRLANGLEALLISDPNADQSAAAMCVDVGSWNDPPEYPGMAHFCEHMLFMGTKKYPDETIFSSTVSDYAGNTNAFTAPHCTVYMFAAQTKGFLELLDPFAHFFIDPLFNPANIAREMHAVDQEFAKNIENDGWRAYMVFKETGNPTHPNCQFSTGNSETLGKIPQSALKTWHREFYGAEKMHLVIYSSLPLQTLKDAVVQTFCEVPPSLQGEIDTSAPLSSSEQIGHITFIKPIQNKQTLTLSWELPPELSNDPTKSADLVAYALRRGQKYSLYEKLKDEQLIDGMSIQVDGWMGLEHRFFQLSLELTRKGIAEIQTVVNHLFEAIAGIRSTGIPHYLFQEKNAMAQLNYQYQERQNPFDFVTKLGGSISEEPLSTYPRNSILSTGYDAEKIASAIAFLTPETCAISLMASPDLIKVSPTHREKWFGAEYAIRPIPDAWMAMWKTAKPNEQIRLAPPNPFFPDQLAIVPPANSTPQILSDDEVGTSYYVRSSEFGVPDAVYHIHILSPELNPSARSAVLTSLYLDHLTDLLHPTLAAAHAAGLCCSLNLERSAIHLQISGYSEKAPLLLQEIAKQMPLDPPTKEQFAIYFDRHQKAYLNAQRELAVRQGKELLDAIVNRDKTTQKEKLAALKTIRYEDFLAFYEKLFEKVYLEALFAGNLSLKMAESAWLDIVHALSRAPYPKEEHFQTNILRLPSSGGPYQISQTTEAQGNATLLLLDEGTFTYAKRAAQEILSAVLKEIFYNELRTKQKTGYIAQSEALEIEEQLFQYFLVQSNSHQPEDLLFRFEQFIEEFNDSLAENISKNRFETLKCSLVSSLKTRFRNLKSKSALWDYLAFERDGNFNFVEKRIDAFTALSYEDFQTIAHTFLSRENRKRLAILFEGKLASPFAYQPISAAQIGNFAIYAPRQEKKSLSETASVSK